MSGKYGDGFQNHQQKCAGCYLMLKLLILTYMNLRLYCSHTTDNPFHCFCLLQSSEVDQQMREVLHTVPEPDQSGHLSCAQFVEVATYASGQGHNPTVAPSESIR